MAKRLVPPYLRNKKGRGIVACGTMSPELWFKRQDDFIPCDKNGRRLNDKTKWVEVDDSPKKSVVSGDEDRYYGESEEEEINLAEEPTPEKGSVVEIEPLNLPKLGGINLMSKEVALKWCQDLGIEGLSENDEIGDIKGALRKQIKALGGT